MNMKKLIYCLTLLLLFSLKSVLALEPTIKFTSQDLGYSDSSAIGYFENIDDQYIGLFIGEIKNGASRSIALLYNLETKKSIELNYIDSNNVEYYYPSYPTYVTYSNKNLIHRFYKKENKIYTIVINDDIKEYLLITDINSLEKIILPIDACSDDIGFISTDQHTFITELNNCEAEFTLFEFTDSSAQKIWNLNLGQWKFSYPLIYQRYAPFVFKDKIFISNLNSLYAFDARSKQGEIIIDDINEYSLQNSDKQITTAPTQYFEFKDDFYFIYNDLSYSNFYLSTIITGKTGNTRIWKSDGTKSGTSLEKVINIPEDETQSFSNFQLFSLNDILYWIGEYNEEKGTAFYRFESPELIPIGDFKLNDNLFKNLSSMIFSIDYIYGILKLYDNTSTIHWKDKEWLPNVNLYYSESENINLYSLNLISIENDVLQIEQMEIPPTKKDLFSVNEDVNVYFTKVIQKSKDEIGIFVVGEVYNGEFESFNEFISFYVFGENNLIPSDSFFLRLDYSGIFSTKQVNDEQLFIYGSPPYGLDAIWSFKLDVPTPIKTHFFEQKDLFKLFPNPSSQYITLQSAEFQKGQMMIVGMDGKVYQSFTFTGHQKNIEISQLSTGMYMTVFVGDGITSTNTFVKH